MQRELVERARSGDADAFAELACTSGDRLYAIASRILRDGDRAADATQQALIAGPPGLTPRTARRRTSSLSGGPGRGGRGTGIS